MRWYCCKTHFPDEEGVSERLSNVARARGQQRQDQDLEPGLLIANPVAPGKFAKSQFVYRLIGPNTHFFSCLDDLFECCYGNLPCVPFLALGFVAGY